MITRSCYPPGSRSIVEQFTIAVLATIVDIARSPMAEEGPLRYEHGFRRGPHRNDRLVSRMSRSDPRERDDILAPSTRRRLSRY